MENLGEDDALLGGPVMTILGKILVIVNLVIAVLVGGFLVFVFARSTNWKKATDHALQENTALRASVAGTKSVTTSLIAERETVINERTKLQEQIDTLKKDYDKKIDDLKKTLSKQETETQKSQVTATAAKAEATRLVAEVADQRKIVTARETTINNLETKNKKLLEDKVNAEQGRDSLKQRTQYLVSQLEALSKKLAQAESRGPSGGVLAKSSNAKNPPSVYVRGKVTEVMRERGLVEISLGSDQGVNEGNTMEVYRLKPRPEYLGSIKILDAKYNRSVGRLIKPEAGTRRSPIVKGDEVASKILTR
jgi:hypothetical protein